MTSNSSDHGWLLQYMVATIPQTISFCILLFNFIGHFGNLNLIIATFKSKSLQSKHGWLLVILCSEHSFCLLCEFINVFFALSGIHISRRTCLSLLSPYICVSFFQAGTFATLAIDVMLSCTYAVKYQKWTTSRYLAVLTAVPVIVPATFMVIVWSRITDEVVFLCNPPLAMDAKTVNLWGGLLFSSNVCILIIYGHVYFYVYGKHKESRETNQTKKVMRSLTILVIVFSFSWFTCIGLVFLIEYVTSNELVITLIRSYAVIFGVIAYSQTFYVYYIRSEMYRKEFKRQLWCRTTERSGRNVLVSRTAASFSTAQ